MMECSIQRGDSRVEWNIPSFTDNIPSFTRVFDQAILRKQEP
jgi:hypothetical protein